jgi:hypothetical protein
MISHHVSGASELGAIAAQIRARLSDAAVADLHARYELGQVVHQLRYGEGPVSRSGDIALLAHCFDIHASALRRIARVAESVPPAEFAYVCSLRDPCGVPLTWSHIEVLSEIRNAQRRRDIARTTSATRLSVRELRELVGRRSSTVAVP